MGRLKYGFLVMLAVIPAGVLAVGCAHKNPLVGSWTGSAPSRFGGKMTTTLTLTDDGKDTMSAQMKTPVGDIQITGSGTYTVNGDLLTQTFTAMSFNGRPAPQTKGPVTEPSHFKLDGDTLTLVDSRGLTQILTRE